MPSIEQLRETPSFVPNPLDVWRQDREDRSLTAMSRGFQRHGGLATGDELVRLMRRRSEQPISRVARWIVDRNVVQFSWQGATLLPLFQFDRDRMLPNPVVISVVRELRDAFDDWQIALWFVTPNPGMNGVAPVDAFESHPLAALLAARTDRSAAAGT